jgi:hypothetical protein
LRDPLRHHRGCTNEQLSFSVDREQESSKVPGRHLLGFVVDLQWSLLMRIVLAVALFGVTTALAQESLRVNQPVERQLSPGSVQSYTIDLKAGDYAAGLLDQHGETDLTILAPDGSPVRRFPSPTEDGKRLFVFIADTQGTHRVEVTTSANQPVSYELTLTQVLSLDERLKPKPWQDPNPSLRIEALRRQVASGNADINAFWKQVTAEGTPLVESIDKDPQHQLVTFLWRGTSETRNVFPIGSFKVGGRYPSDYVFHQMPLTDVWYLTVRLPTGARFTYGLSEICDDTTRSAEPQPMGMRA